MNQETVKRIIIGPCRSGTSALFHAFEQLPNVEGYFQTVKDGLRKNGVPGYDFFKKQSRMKGKVILGKETIGHSVFADCTFSVFPNPEAIKECRPVFIFRNPVDTFNSWVIQKLGNEYYFMLSYLHTFHQYQIARLTTPQVTLITYESFLNHPEAVLRTICERWDLNFDLRMLEWEEVFGGNPTIDTDGLELGHYRSLQNSSTIQKQKVSWVLSEEQRAKIASELEILYLRIQGVEIKT